ncbi:MAG TPA: efflux RND transporter periplasmic adaptor subunit [Polyangiaceae bacterium]|nr:efflux RND transporter periplasmic adaptor subunit [Polyangiaceae bacterium]
MDDRIVSDLASLRIDRQERPPSSGRALRWLLALLVTGAVAVAAWRIALPMFEARVFSTEVSLTEVALVSPAQAQIQLTSAGYVVPQVEVDVSSKLVGRVDKSNVREGDRVKQGQTLFELDASDQRTQVASALARVAAARARAATARAQLAEVTQQLEREKRLAATGAIATATADDLAARSKSLAEQVRAADADVDASQAEVNALAVNLGNTVIKAPIDGTVITKPLQPGDVVSPGTSMLKLADFASIVVETDVPETRLHLVAKGAPCEIVLDAYPSRRWRGEVVDTSPQLNRAKATATVKVRFLDRDDTVLPEMAARVSFLDAPLDERKLKEPPKRIVPGAAVTDRGGAKVVFTVDGGRARMVPVTLGSPFGGGFELVEGPAPGSKLVSDPAPTLGDGQTIKEKSP